MGPPISGRDNRSRVKSYNQEEPMADADRELAFANIKKAAAHYGVDVLENSWRELGSRR